jgi:hypothetical protein
MAYDPDQRRDPLGTPVAGKAGGGRWTSDVGYHQGTKIEDLIPKIGDRVGGVAWPLDQRKLSETIAGVYERERDERYRIIDKFDRPAVVSEYNVGQILQTPEEYRKTLMASREKEFNERRDGEREELKLVDLTGTPGADPMRLVSVWSQFSKYGPIASFKSKEEADAWVAKRKNAEDTFNKLFPTFESYSAAVEASLKERMDNASPGSLMPSSVLNKMLKDEVMQNVFETSKSGAAGNKGGQDARVHYAEMRAYQDARAFGIPLVAGGSERPVYGIAVDKEHATHSGSLFYSHGQYGNALVIFKDSMKTHATFTDGDSLDGRSRISPSPFLHPKAYSSYEGNSSYSDMLDHLSIKSVGDKRFGFHEVQYHDRPTKHDIKFVYFSAEPPANVLKKLKKAGIPWAISSYDDVVR